MAVDDAGEPRGDWGARPSQAGVELGVLVERGRRPGSRRRARASTGAAPGRARGRDATASSFDGLMGYEGHCASEPDPAVRAAEARASDGAARRGRRRAAAARASTSAIGLGAARRARSRSPATRRGVTEVQAGSYVLMDHFHAPLVDGFGFALTVMATVIGRHGDLAMLDAGRKSVESSLRPLEPPDPRATLAFVHEEHIGLPLRRARPRSRRRSRAASSPGYAPTTVNLFGAYHVVRGRPSGRRVAGARAPRDAVRAGHLSAELAGPTCAASGGAAWRSRRPIQVTVRDERWGTLRPTLRRADVGRGRRRRSRSTLEAAHGDGGSRGAARIEGRPTGPSTSRSRARPSATSSTGGSGSACSTRGRPTSAPGIEADGAGVRTVGAFPREIAPQPLVDGEYPADGPAVRCASRSSSTAARARDFAFEGEADGWELEDQRNWTDASFKSYPTPLRRSAPRTLRARVSACASACDVRIAGERAAARRTDGGPVLLHVGAPGGCVAPDVGLTAPLARRWTRARSSRSLPAHLRVAAACPAISTGSAARRRSRRRRASRWRSCCCSTTRRTARASTRWCARSADAAVARVLVLRAHGRHGRTAGSSRGLRPHLGPLASASPRGRDRVALLGAEPGRARPVRPGCDGARRSVRRCTTTTSARWWRRWRSRRRSSRECGRSPAAPTSWSFGRSRSRPRTRAPDDAELDARVGSDFAAAWTVGSVALSRMPRACGP